MSSSVRRRPLVAALLASATCLGLLTACGEGSGPESSDAGASAGDGSFPVSLTTAWGRTEVTEKPVR
ncbi:ABC transporter substrate-binding protein, partial [Streptomyces sp. SID7499]|nr:ABC transporter substrate-binding protein [Streptomyces sp. SID7499]